MTSNGQGKKLAGIIKVARLNVLKNTVNDKLKSTITVIEPVIFAVVVGILNNLKEY